MDIQVMIEKLRLNGEMINELQVKRDFRGLINCYEESLSLDNSMHNNWMRLPQIAYCYIKLNDLEKAKQILKKYSNYSFMADPDEVYRATMLLGLFLQIGENPYVEEMINNTLNSWISDPKSASQTKNIVFDYKDYF